MKRSFFSKLFSPTIAGLDIGDQSVKYAILRSTREGSELVDFGMVPLPVGVIVSGDIQDPKKLSAIISGLKQQKNIKHARVSLPMSHAFVIENAGITPHAHELRVDALTRVLIPQTHTGASMLVHFGEHQTDIAIVHDGRVYLARSLSLPHNPTRSLAEMFGISENEARSIKRTIGLSRRLQDQAVLDVLLPDVVALARALNTLFIDWHTQKTPNYPIVDQIILSGSNAHIAGLVEYLSSALRMPVVLGNPWKHLNQLETYVPPMHAEDSLAYAVALGLARGR